MIFNIIGIILIVIADQVSKLFTLIYLNERLNIPIISDIFYLTYRPNTGAALSILQGKQTFLIIVSTLAIIFAFYILARYYKTSSFLRIGVVFVIGGAMGNLIDRFRLGFVVDMLGFMRFFIFNIADSFISIGAVLIIIYVFKSMKSEKNEKV